MPQFFKKFSVDDSSVKNNYKKLLRPDHLTLRTVSKTLLLQSCETSKNQYKSIAKLNSTLVLVKLIEHPFIKSSKSVNLYSITEDYFEQEVNNVFCKNNEFVESGETIDY